MYVVLSLATTLTSNLTMNNQLASITRPEYSPGYLYRAQLQRTRDGGQRKATPCSLPRHTDPVR